MLELSHVASRFRKTLYGQALVGHIQRQTVTHFPTLEGFTGWRYMELLRKRFCICCVDPWETYDPSVLQPETLGPNQPLVLSGCPSTSGFRHIGTLHWRFPGCTCSVDKESISVFSVVSSILVTAQPMQPTTTWDHFCHSYFINKD